MSRTKWKKKHGKLTLRSGFEKKTATFLDNLGLEYEYETEKLHYTEPATRRTYTPDFILANGILVECKGAFTAPQRKKMAAVVEQNPDKDIRMLFMRNNAISKSSKTRYSDWCEKRNIKYHVSANGSLPEEWLTEKPAKKKQEKK